MVTKFVLALFLIKEFVQTGMAYARFRQGKALPGAIPAGKACTTVLFISLTLLVLMPDINPHWVHAFAAVDCLFLGYALIRYIFAFFGRHSKVQDIQL